MFGKPLGSDVGNPEGSALGKAVGNGRRSGTPRERQVGKPGIHGLDVSRVGASPAKLWPLGAPGAGGADGRAGKSEGTAPGGGVDGAETTGGAVGGGAIVAGAGG